MPAIHNVHMAYENAAMLVSRMLVCVYQAVHATPGCSGTDGANIHSHNATNSDRTVIDVTVWHFSEFQKALVYLNVKLVRTTGKVADHCKDSMRCVSLLEQ